MKFAKTYIETLASSHFPDEWKRGAVDYRQLKKLINGVVDELESLGLGADVLKDLLVPPAEEVSGSQHEGHEQERDNAQQQQHSAAAASLHAPPQHHRETPAEQWIDTLPSSAQARSLSRQRTASADSGSYGHTSSSGSDHDHDHDHDHNDQSITGDSLLAPPPSGTHKKRRKSSHTATAKTPADLMRTHDTLMRRAESAASSASASSSSDSAGAKTSSFSAHSAGAGSSKSNGSATSQADKLNDTASDAASDASSDWAKPAKPSHSADEGKSHLDSEGRRWLNGKDGRRARAEYELGGTPEHPIPRVRLFIESPIASDDEEDDSEDTNDAAESHDEGGDNSEPLHTFPASASMSSSRSGFSASGTVRPASTKAGDSPVTLRGRSTDSPASSLIARTPVITTAGVAADEAEAAGKLEALPEPALDALHPDSAHLDGSDADRRNRRRRHLSPSSGRRYRRREITIPLTADTEFLESLTGALQNLSRIQEQQREHFVAATENLCSSIARVASPYATPNDMYVWREIFALWVDSQIFESSRERDRGELSVEESEVRLKKFAEELAKRGWIARPAFISEDAADVAAVEAEQEGGATAAAGGVKKKKGATLFRLGHPNTPHHSHKQPETMTMADGTVVHVSHDSRTQSALDDFLKLNVELLDVKKFQAVNVEAARKILKKHDKRTALTAAHDLRAFMALQEREREQLLKSSAQMVGGDGVAGGSGLSGAERLNLMEINGGIAPRPLSQAPHALPLANFDALSLSGRSGPSTLSGSSSSSSRELTTMTHPSLAALLPTSTTGLMGGSLPHILLSLFTTTLLPILPSIDESSCVICTSVAWRPVRLVCGHLFCIRCLVKLQRQHRDDCPLCRAPLAVKKADGSNLDEAMGNLLKTYFPEEVREKQRENDREVQAEEEKEMGLEKTHCIIC
ncbi:hypothetical protein OC834_006441 [Tilletia horrida]|nr:hypothetical protein OC834_006441 [Tilletia horrida]